VGDVVRGVAVKEGEDADEGVEEKVGADPRSSARSVRFILQNLSGRPRVVAKKYKIQMRALKSVAFLVGVAVVSRLEGTMFLEATLRRTRRAMLG